MASERDIDEAMETASRCRLFSSQVRQLGIFGAYADWLLDNAKGAERWAVKAAKELSPAQTRAWIETAHKPQHRTAV